MKLVYVISKNNKPLMPTMRNGHVRKLLRDGLAKVVSREPFTIKLKYDCPEVVEDLTLGIDPGSKKIGTSVIKESKSNRVDVLYLSEVEVRTDIKSTMDQRRMYRRTRRSRKLRYRKPRFLNRRNSIKHGRYPPSIKSKIDSHIKEIEFVMSILPISKIIIESNTFDPHALSNPVVLKHPWLYSKGPNYTFSNRKEYIKSRDNYTCQNCKGKSKDKHLHVHHIIFRSNGGTDDVNNLILLCKPCHDIVHLGNTTLKIKKNKSNLKHSTHMNIIRNVVVDKLKIRFSNLIETSGYITSENRRVLNLNKEHYIDASVISSEGKFLRFLTNSLILKKCVSDGDYKQSFGSRSEMKFPPQKLFGFRRYDKVKYLGQNYFIKGKYSTGYSILMNIDGIKVDFVKTKTTGKIPKFSRFERLTARKSWLIDEIMLKL